MDFQKIKDNANTVSDMLKAVAHPIRLMILCRLSNGEQTVHELEEIVETSQSNMSQHLAKLRSCGILETRKEANHVYYRVKDRKVIALVELLQKTYC